ncbi:MAG: DNA polymerase III subunit beta [Thermoleophilia bacterium]|nr:DNA polymerase III subunit beta [Thermoleophilia bacterium]
MRLTVNRARFVDALAIVGRAVSARSAIPALSGIHLLAETGALTLTATDGDLSIRTKIDADVEAGGAIVVPGRLLADVARQLPSDDVSIAVADAGLLELKCGSAAFKLRLLAADDFPRIAALEGAPVELPVGEFAETIEQVARAASRDETRPHLTGILISVDGDKLRAVATDSYRLAVRTTKIGSPVSGRIEANVPARALQEAVRVSEGSEAVKIALTDRQISFTAGETLLVSRLIDGQFPDFEQLLPDSYEHQLDIDVFELFDAVRRVSLLAQRNTPLRVALSDGEMEVSAQTADVGEARETIPAPDFSGEPLEIGFNPDFLREGLDSAHTERARLKLISPFRPGLIVAGEDDEFMYLVMPIRLNT